MPDKTDKHLYLITGTSRGIGEALAQKLLDPENQLFCISRNKNPRLSVQASQRDTFLVDFEIDLSQPAKIREVMKEIFRSVQPANVASISLVNNAGTVKPIRELGGDEANDALTSAMNLNLVAPLLLSDIFIRSTKGWKVPRRILNISSGAAGRPLHGWGAYCAAKSGLEMLTQCIALEQSEAEFPVKAVSLAPGMVNTEMQDEIRSASASFFPERARFVSAKEKGELLDPHLVAAKVAALLQSADFGKETLLHIRQLL